MSPLLVLDRLAVRFGAVEAIRGLDLTVAPGETAALVGETGSGKSVAMLATLGLLPHGAIVSGSARFERRELLGLDRRKLDRIRGRDVAIVFQEPQSALDPLFSVGSQIAAVLRHSQSLSRRAAWNRACELLDETGIVEPARRLRSYPHELSGGQRQRVAIAMALACEPKLLIADEPTTALDVTVAARILELLATLKARHGMALVLISHDLAIVRRVADTIHVMEKGVLVESGPAAAIMGAAKHPYTCRLLAADRLPAVEPDTKATERLLAAEGLTVIYPLRGGWRRSFTAVDRVDLEIGRGETLALIGESGSGKSTLGRALLRLTPSSGRISFEGHDLQALSAKALLPLRRDLQIVFQDPFSSLSPRLRVGEIVAEGLSVHNPELSRAARFARAASALEEVGLAAAFAARRPHALSGGQRQRVAIARAMILSPKLVVLDEPTSALDRSVQADVLSLLRRLQRERGLSYLFITHDLAVVRAMATRVAVMKDGRIVEVGTTSQVLRAPRDAYTATLVAAAALDEASAAAAT